MSTNQKKHKSGILHSLSFVSQIGLTMASCVFIGIFVGKFLDKHLNTSPWFLLAFSLLGIVAALRSIFSLGKKNGDKG